VKRLLLTLIPVAAFAAAPSNDWSPNLTTSAAWVTNVSNGEAVWDRVNTLLLSADALSSSQYTLTRSDIIHVTLHLAGDWYPRFQAVNRAAGGLRVDWQHTFGKDEFAPVFTVEAAGDEVITSETLRRGTDTAVTLKLKKQFAAGWRAGLTQCFDDYNAKHVVFDSRSSETAFEIGRDINDATRLTFTGRWRDGDIVTHAQYSRPDLAAIARDLVQVRTFHLPMTAYATKAKTSAARVALIHATTDISAVVLSYEYAQTKRTGLQFENQTVAIAFVQQF
jgi:hypothetical protein